MKICEEFETIQGEGKYVGVPSYFIRTTGCNLRCAWKNLDDSVTICDTPYSSFKPEKGYELDVDKVLSKLEKTAIKHIVITGGEPTIQTDIPNIVNRFIEHEYLVTVETNGTVYYENMSEAFMSISPKLESSYAQTNERERKLHKKNNIWIGPTRSWMNTNDYQLKFVVNEHRDINDIDMYRKILQTPRENIYLMPQGITEEQFKQKQKWMFDECIKHGYNYTPRLQIDIFGNKRGT